jgi:uncharacterized damage-inducible protein DinB
MVWVKFFSIKKIPKMIARIKWVERKFDFSQPVGLFPMTLERLGGTPVRLMHIASLLSNEQLRKKENEAWSVQEHIGHLLDLEELHEGRIDDFLEGKEMLRAADMSNEKTNSADHNSEDVKELLKKFRDERNHFVKRLEDIPENILHQTSIHPRLKVPMRPVDMALFTAEHDDHHLAIVRELIKKMS